MAAGLCWLVKPDWLTIIVNVVIADAVIREDFNKIYDYLMANFGEE